MGNIGNKDNLIGKGFESRTTEEARDIGRRGGIASGQARRKKRLLKDYLEILLEQEVDTDKKTGKPILGVEAMAVKAMQAAMNGDWKAWELVRDTAGQKPVDKVMVSDVDPEVINEVENIVNGIE